MGALRGWPVALRRWRSALRRWFSDHQRGTLLIGLASLLVAVLALLNDYRSANSSPPEDGAGSAVPTGSGDPSASVAADPSDDSTAGAAPLRRTWPAKIVNTYSEEEQRFRGVLAARSPYVPGAADRGYLEGNVIYVLCQVYDGRQMVDKVADETLSSRVWDKTTDEVWIPDIYADLPTQSGDRPPRCQPDDLPAVPGHTEAPAGSPTAGTFPGDPPRLASPTTSPG